MAVADKVNKIVKNKAKSYIQIMEDRKQQLLEQFNTAETDDEKIEILKQGILWLLEVNKSIISKKI